MNDSTSLTIRAARLRAAAAPVDITIKDGLITGIRPAGSGEVAGAELDAAGNLVTESFVNTHLHLDKVFTLRQLGDAAGVVAVQGDRLDRKYLEDWASRPKLDLATRLGQTRGIPSACPLPID